MPTSTEKNAVLAYVLQVLRLKDIQSFVNKDNPGFFHKYINVTQLIPGNTTKIGVSTDDISDFCLNDVIKFANLDALTSDWKSRLTGWNNEVLRIRSINESTGIMEIYLGTFDLSPYTFSGDDETAYLKVFSTLNKDILLTQVENVIALFETATKIDFDYTSHIHLQVIADIMKIQIHTLSDIERINLNSEIRTRIQELIKSKKMSYTSEDIVISDEAANNNSDMDNPNFRSLRGV